MKKVYRLTIIEDEHGDVEWEVDTPEDYEVFPDDLDALVDGGVGYVMFVPVHQRLLEFVETIMTEAEQPDHTGTPTVEEKKKEKMSSDEMSELQHIMYSYAPRSGNN